MRGRIFLRDRIHGDGKYPGHRNHVDQSTGNHSGRHRGRTPLQCDLQGRDPAPDRRSARRRSHLSGAGILRRYGRTHERRQPDDHGKYGHRSRSKMRPVHAGREDCRILPDRADGKRTVTDRRRRCFLYSDHPLPGGRTGSGSCMSVPGGQYPPGQRI